MKIFLDDIRKAPDQYDLVFRTGEDLIAWLKVNKDTEIDLISFDHDLGDGKIDGYEVVKKLVELDPKIIRVQFHTDNLQGLENMFWYLRNAKKAGLLSDLRTINPRKIICIDGEESVSNYFNAMNVRRY